MFRVEGLGFGSKYIYIQIILVMENQREKSMVHEMESRVIKGHAGV